MNFLKIVFFALLVAVCAHSALAQVQTVEEYNKTLPYWGTSWTSGSGSVNGYYPSFYTGFAMRSAFPDRIHIRTARGNQTRVTVILDDQTISDYMFDLVKRESFYRKVTSPGARLNIKPSGGKFLPHLAYFQQVLSSEKYGILPFVEQAKAGQKSSEAIYGKGLEVLTALNPGRVFALQINLKNEFNRWKADMVSAAGGDVARITGNPKATVVAINSLVFGRINYTDKPSADVMAKLTTALTAAVQNASDDQFIPAALNLFKAVTGSKYDFRVVGVTGQWEKALQCNSNSCVLNYSEFTAVYPTGSVLSSTRDEHGNSINSFATPGLWNFVQRGAKGVDNIRNEPYYGWAPKMDFQAIGNGFHNPGLRFWGPSKAVKQSLGVSMDHQTLWAVKRGAVSHGCLRLSTGHVWEMRQILPVENEKMTKVFFFGTLPQDLDLYDVDGNGSPEVVGVEYLISYGLKGTDDVGRREGTDMDINDDKKLEFYTELYGARNVFQMNSQSEFVFSNPHISMPSYMDLLKASVGTRLTLKGDYKLFEQRYEQDKLQFYSLGSDMGEGNKTIVRLMGRVRGCAPTTDKKQCGEAAFDQEARGLGL